MHHGSDTSSIPSHPICPWRGEICAAYTGPNTGLTLLELDSTSPPDDSSADTVVAGCTNWNSPNEFAYGISLSLYEEDRRRNRSPREAPARTPSSSIMGDPIADVFGIVVRENCCVMAIADGVNWGKKSRLAARCATRAVMDHVSCNLSRLEADHPMSGTVVQLLEEAVTLKAQALILGHHATLTTLSAAVVCEMKTKTPGREWGLFVCAVGDSPVYVYCPESRQVVEATLGCHDGTRDMRMAGGVLGPSLGSSPDLSNLTYAYLPVYPGDIVFAVSDGISDNFSNKAMRGLRREKEELLLGGKPAVETCCENTPPHLTSSGEKVMLPADKPALRSCCENIPHLTSVLQRHQETIGAHLSAQTVTACLVNHAVAATHSKRLLRTQCLEENIDMRLEAAVNPEFAAKLSAASGKLDHAAVVAYQVGQHSPW